jgi:hypothetical protein
MAKVIPLDGTVCELLFAHRVKPAEHFPAGMLRRLLRTGLVEPVEVFARPWMRLETPLAVIGRDDPEPNYDALAYAAEKRLEEPRELTVYRATRRAANIYGGTVPLSHQLQMGHDVQISSVLEAHRKRGVNIDNWISEDQLGALKGLLPKIPDALVFGAPIIAVEVIGDYPATRIREFVRAFNGYDWQVELW